MVVFGAGGFTGGRLIGSVLKKHALAKVLRTVLLLIAGFLAVLTLLTLPKPVARCAMGDRYVYIVYAARKRPKVVTRPQRTGPRRSRFRRPAVAPAVPSPDSSMAALALVTALAVLAWLPDVPVGRLPWRSVYEGPDLPGVRAAICAGLGNTCLPANANELWGLRKAPAECYPPVDPVPVSLVVAPGTEEGVIEAAHVAAREALRCFPYLDEGTHGDPYDLVPEPEQAQPLAS
ncbi:hypothetical protein ACWCRD_12760 [Streptomyces sp. NPDC002092]